MSKVCAVEDISFSDMKQDETLGQWGIVKRNFVGTITEPVPHSVYNRLLEKIPKDIRNKNNLKPEPMMNTGISSQLYATEAEFEEKEIVPLLKRWGLKYKQQHPCRFRVGSQNHTGRVDFYVSDQHGPLTLFEDKLMIRDDKDLKLAVNQAKSYAILLGLPSFVVASPEGLQLYTLNKNEESLVKKISLNEMPNHANEEEFRKLLLKQRP